MFSTVKAGHENLGDAVSRCLQNKRFDISPLAHICQQIPHNSGL